MLSHREPDPKLTEPRGIFFNWLRQAGEAPVVYCHLAVKTVILLGQTAYYPVASLIITMGCDSS